MLGIANALSVGMGGGGGAVYSPLDETDLVAWYSESTDTTTDGVQATVWYDAAPSPANAVEGDPGAGPTYQATRWNGQPCLKFSTQSMQSNAAKLTDLINGTDKELTIVQVIQNLSNTTHYYAGFGHPTNARHFLCYALIGAYHAVYDTRSAAGTISSSNEVALNTPGPIVRVWRKVAGEKVQFSQDGVSEPAVSVAMSDFTGVTDFSVGSNPTASAIEGGNFLCKHTFVFSGNKSDASLASLYAWLRSNVSGLEWKSGLGATAAGATGNTLVVPVFGQSNASGRGTTAYSPSGANLFALHSDMFRKALSEPTADATDTVFGVNDYGAGVSLCSRLADYLRSNWAADDIMFVNCAVGGQGAAAWVASAGVSPPAINTLMGRFVHQVTEALKAPGARLGPCIWWAGESDANSAVNSAAYASNVDTIFSAIVTAFSGKFYDDTARFVVVQLPPTAYGGYAYWADVRTAQATVCSTTRTDSILVSAPDTSPTPGGLHLDTGSDDTTGLRKVAVDIGAAWITAVGGAP